MERRPGIHRAPFRNAARSGGFVLALGGVALVLGHGGEALTLAGVQALAGVRTALAGALALAGVGADALTFAGGVGHGRHGGAGQEQGGGSGGNRGAGLGSHLHGHLLANKSDGAPSASRGRQASQIAPGNNYAAGSVWLQVA